jgi:hypothetical protein
MILVDDERCQRCSAAAFQLLDTPAGADPQEFQQKPMAEAVARRPRPPLLRAAGVFTLSAMSEILPTTLISFTDGQLTTEADAEAVLID